MTNVQEAVRMGFLAWGQLAIAMGGIFIVVLFLNKLGKKKSQDKKETEQE